MIDGLKPYPCYKDSGVPWLGEVPEHWKLLPNRALFVEVNDRNHPNEEMLSVTITRGIVRQKVLLTDSSKKDSSNQDKSAYKLVCPRDIAYNKMRAWQGAIGVSDYRGIVSPAYVIMRLREDHNARYFHHLYRTPYFAKEAECWSYGITSDMWSLRPEHFRMIYSALPPREEQDSIVRFLDHADRRIRRLIRAKKKLIVLLNERKRVIIHRAVTGGLYPNVPVKPSGEDWVGHVPGHWRVLSLGVGAQSIQTGPFGSQLHAHEYVTGGIPVINPSHIQNGTIIADEKVTVDVCKATELERHKLRVGDVVSARRGELGRSGLVSDGQDSWLCGTGSLRIRPRPEMFDSAYLVQLLGSSGVRDTLSLASIGATMENLNAGMVARLRLPCPPTEEQREIMAYILSRSERIDAASQSAHCEINLLLEYRTRLVADVVTGKLDVRHLAEEAGEQPGDEADMPEEADETDSISNEPEEEEVGPETES